MHSLNTASKQYAEVGYAFSFKDKLFFYAHLNIWKSANGKLCSFGEKIQARQF